MRKDEAETCENFRAATFIKDSFFGSVFTLKFVIKEKGLFLLSLSFQNKMCQPRNLFYSFQITILHKNCRRQRDSNTDRWSRRRACWPLDHHRHGPKQKCAIFKKWAIPGLFFLYFRLFSTQLTVNKCSI